jgi:hypothetical protein
MSKVNFGFLEVDLNQFVVAVKNLVGGDLDKESMSEITKMIEEVRKTYDTILMSLLPFYNVVHSNDDTYVAQFTSQCNCICPICFSFVSPRTKFEDHTGRPSI